MADTHRAIRILSEKPTEHGYCIREEYWPGFSGQVEVFNDPDGTAGDFATDIQNVIDDAPSEMLMTTCYTDDGYWIGDLEEAKFLCEEIGIAPRPYEGVERGELRPCSHGWCEKEQRWYGWSHRARYGFGVGSEVKKGDCAYRATGPEDFLDDMVRFWSGDNHINVRGFHSVNDAGEQGVQIEWTYDDNTPNKAIRGQISGAFQQYPERYGHGEWTAMTLDDARQMALDFAEGVS